MSEEYKSTPLKVSVHRPGHDPVYGDGVTHIEITDEGAGAFITMTQPTGDTPNEFRFDIEELEAVTKAARNLINNQPKVNAS